jgi:hypothetical protein
MTRDETIELMAQVMWEASIGASWDLLSQKTKYPIRLEAGAALDALIAAGWTGPKEGPLVGAGDGYGKFAMTDRRSGCSCNIDDDDNLTKTCNLHRDLIEQSRLAGLEEAAKVAKLFLREDSKIEPVGVKYILAYAAAIRERMK